MKASEIYSLQTEAEFKVKEEISIEIAKKLIKKGLDNEYISEVTDLSLETNESLRN